MTMKELKVLKIGDKVRWTMPDVRNPDGIGGEIVEVGYAGVKIMWDDSTFAVVSYNQDEKDGFLENVSRA